MLPAHNPFSIMFTGFWLALVAQALVLDIAELADPSSALLPKSKKPSISDSCGRSEAGA